MFYQQPTNTRVDGSFEYTATRVPSDSYTTAVWVEWAAQASFHAALYIARVRVYLVSVEWVGQLPGKLKDSTILKRERQCIDMVVLHLPGKVFHGFRVRFHDSDTT